MKKFKISLIFILTFLISSCSFIDIEIGSVEKPSMYTPPISGKWTISKCIFKNNKNKINFDYRAYIGKDVAFSKSGIIVADFIFKNPTFKAKKVNANKYFKKIEFKINDINLESDNIYIIKIKDAAISCEVFIISEDTAYVFINDIIFKIKRLTNEISKDEYNDILKRYLNCNIKLN